MRPLIKYVVGRNCPSQFVSVRIAAGQVMERMILKNGKREIDISNRNSVVCQRPMHIAVSLTQDQRTSFDSDHFEVSVIKGTQTLSTTKLTLINEIKANGASIFLFKALDGDCYQSNALIQNLLLRRFKNPHKHTHHEKKIQAALYSYPRNIIVVSFKDREYYNIFPMDFQCALPDNDLHIFGLRTTNITLEKILSEKKMVVSDPSAADIKTIYFLGSHNSKIPPKIEDLPFGTIESEQFKFPVPAFATSYKEIEVITNQLLGSHMFFVGKVINKQEIKERTSSLCHLHFFQYIKSGYKEEV
jgi:flavin reductase (DIM6/NTAB) family NADH-FMN oxidoreductase RutF